MRRLRAEMAAKAAELREVRAAEQEAAEDCERLSRDLAAERLRAKVCGRGREEVALTQGGEGYECCKLRGCVRCPVAVWILSCCCCTACAGVR